MDNSAKNAGIRASKTGQISIEYLVIVGFTLAVILGLSVTFGIYQHHNRMSVISAETQSVARSIVDSAQQVYYYGPPTKTTLKVYFPPQIRDINIYDKAIVFQLDSGGSTSDIEAVSSVNMSGSLPVSRGIKYIEVQAKENYVHIQEK